MLRILEEGGSFFHVYLSHQLTKLFFFGLNSASISAHVNLSYFAWYTVSPQVKGIGGGGDPKRKACSFISTVKTMCGASEHCSSAADHCTLACQQESHPSFFLRSKYNPKFSLVKVTKQVMIVTSKGINMKNQLLDLKMHKLQAVLCFKKTTKKKHELYHLPAFQSLLHEGSFTTPVSSVLMYSRDCNIPSR